MEEKNFATDTGCKMKKHLRGVNCDVAHCTYNNGHQECCAAEINVGPHNADCSADTVCATFKPKAY